MYEFFDHTADIGLRVKSRDLEELFREAAEGFLSVVVERIPQRGIPTQLEFNLEADRLEFLLVDWLNELLYVLDTKHLLLDAFEVRITDTTLAATAMARPFDLEQDQLLREVKAVTYHNLRVEQTEEGWIAEVILDI